MASPDRDLPKRSDKTVLDAEKDGKGPGHSTVSILRNSEGILHSQQRKLVLHLDLNNTILLSDAITGQGPKAALNSYLSTVMWGKLSPTGRHQGSTSGDPDMISSPSPKMQDSLLHVLGPSARHQRGVRTRNKSEGEWETLSEVPSVLSPSEGAINFYTQFGRSDDFTNTSMGQRFKNIHSDHLHMLEWTYPPDKVFTLSEDGKSYHWILPSFFHLLKTLHLQGRHFSVVLRTFGTDLPKVLHALQCAVDGRHPQFPDFQMMSLPIDPTPGQIQCSKQEVVLTHGAECFSTKTDETNVYKYFSSMEGIRGFRDHFDWWVKNAFSSKGGKPFWIDPHDPSVQHIFIDDNIRLNEGDCIVQTKVCMEGNPCQTIGVSELYNVCLVQTDLLRAISEKDYFLECIRICEERYTDYINNFKPAVQTLT
ncbi:uncharacterized protein [Ambystoma mexicanum]|uniref:uncharacterized protein isoform X1 n=1 Tax=Ambystoma mexicanum TaxID=8296 RepID=UPI0037E72D1B